MFMNRETIQELLQRRPFESFVIHMTNGEKFEVRHPEMAILLKTKVIVGDPENDRSWICSLLHVATIESPQAA
jgi:hypothetical protein